MTKEAKNDKQPQLTFSMTLEGENAKRFEKIRKYYGLENNTEVIRILLYEKFKQLFPEEV